MMANINNAYIKILYNKVSIYIGLAFLAIIILISLSQTLSRTQLANRLLMVGVTAGGNDIVYSLDCNSPPSCQNYIDTIREISSNSNDPQLARFSNIIDEIKSRYIDGEYNSWSLDAHYNIIWNGNDYKIELFRLSSSAFSEGNIHYGTSVEYGDHPPDSLSSGLEELTINTEEFLDHIEDILLIRSRSENSRNSYSGYRISIIIEEVSKISSSIVLLIAASLCSIYGMVMLLLSHSGKRRARTSKIKYGIAALTISLPILLTLATV